MSFDGNDEEQEEERWFLACLRNKQKCLIRTISELKSSSFLQHRRQVGHTTDYATRNSTCIFFQRQRDHVVQMAMAEQRYRDALIHSQAAMAMAMAMAPPSSSIKSTSNQAYEDEDLCPYPYEEIVHRIMDTCKPPPTVESILLTIRCFQDGFSKNIIRSMLDINDVYLPDIQLDEIWYFLQRMETDTGAADDDGHDAISLEVKNISSMEIKRSYQLRSFHRCLRENNVRDVKLYLASSSNIEDLWNVSTSTNSRSRYDSIHTALSFAASLGHYEIVNALLDHSLENTDDNDDDNDRYVNVCYNNCNHEFINQCNKLGQSALHVASNANHINVVRLLLTHGADIYHRDKYGNLPLHYACKTGHDAIMSELVSHAHERIHTLLRGSWDLDVHVEGLLSNHNITSIFKKTLEYHGSDYFQTNWCWDVVMNIYSNYTSYANTGLVTQQSKSSRSVQHDLPRPMQDVMNHVLNDMYATELSGVWSMDGTMKQHNRWISTIPTPHILQSIVYSCFQYSAVNQPNNLGYTPLHLACVEDRDASHFNIIESIACNHYCLIDWKDKSGKNPLDHLRRKCDMSASSTCASKGSGEQLQETLKAISELWKKKVQNDDREALCRFNETLDGFCKEAEASNMEHSHDESSSLELEGLEIDESPATPPTPTPTLLTFYDCFRMLDRTTSTLICQFSLYDEYYNHNSCTYFYHNRYHMEMELKAIAIQRFYRAYFRSHHPHTSMNIGMVMSSAISFHMPMDVWNEKKLNQGWELMRERSDMMHIHRLSHDDRDWVKYHEPISGQEFYWCSETRQYCWDVSMEESYEPTLYTSDNMNTGDDDMFTKYLLDCESANRIHFDPSCSTRTKPEALLFLHFHLVRQEKRYYPCRWGCSCMIKLGSRHQSFHERKVCPRRIVQCALGCTLHLTQERWEQVSKNGKDGETILQWHQENQCPKRLVRCEYCQLLISFDALEHHKSDECLSRPATKVCHCRLGCGAEFRKFTKVDMDEEREQHEQEFCPERDEVCQWRGCSQVLKYKFMKEHVLFHIHSRGISTFQVPGLHIYRVPKNTPSLNIRIWGAGGGGSGNENETLGGSQGGGGAFIEALGNVSKVEELILWVGHGGLGGSLNNNNMNISHFHQSKNREQVVESGKWTRGISAGSKWAGGSGGQFSAVLRRHKQEGRGERWVYHAVLLIGGGGGGGVRNGDSGCIHDQIFPDSFEWQTADSLINERFLLENFAGEGGGAFIHPGITRGGAGGKYYVDEAYATEVTLKGFECDEHARSTYGKGGCGLNGCGKSGSNGRIEIGMKSYFFTR